jgi:hypothetical protein
MNHHPHETGVGGQDGLPVPERSQANPPDAHPALAPLAT